MMTATARRTSLVLMAVLVALVGQSLFSTPAGATDPVTVSNFTHTPETPAPGQDLKVTVDVTSNETLTTVQVQTCVGETCQLPKEMTKKSGNTWEGTVLGKNDDQTNVYKDKDKVEVTILVTYGTAGFYTAEDVHEFIVSSAPPDPSTFKTEGDCEAANFYWYGGACHAKDRDAPANYTTNTTCVGVSYYWYNTSCHSDPQKTPANCTTQAMCTENGYNWWNSSCHMEQKPPEAADFKDMAGCEKAGFYWYDDKCNSQPPADDGGKKKPGPGFELAMLMAAMVVALVAISVARRRQ